MVRFHRLVTSLLLALLAGCQFVAYTRPQPETESDRLARKVADAFEAVAATREDTFRTKPSVLLVPGKRRCAEIDSAKRAGWFAWKGEGPSFVSDGIWRTLGFLPVDSTEASRELGCVAIQAIYQTRLRRILLFDDASEESREHSLAHEMVHALQDQRVGLRRLLHSATEPDEIVGILGALEGEAEYVSALATGVRAPHQDCGPPVQGGLWLLDKSIRADSQLSKLSKSVSLTAYVPYVFGERLACVLHHRLGNAGLDTLLARPPKGSWQIRDVDSYLQAKSPRDWDSAWKFLPQLPKGWVPVGHARSGEARLAGILLDWDRDGARDVLLGSGMGWRGDRIWAVRRGVETAFFWRLAFDSPSKARAFARAWWKARGTRLGGGAPEWSGKAGTIAWVDGKKVARIVVLAGAEVGVGEGFDRETTARFLARTMRRKARGI